MNHCPRTGKRSYESEWEAKQAFTKIGERLKKSRRSKRKRWEGKPYLCGFCGSWHMSSKSVV